MADPREIASRDYYPELSFQTSRSSGPGGQHVNKLETRVTLRFSPFLSQLLSEPEKARLLAKWERRLNKEGYLILHSEKHRNQLQNKQEVVKKFRKLIQQAFTQPKPRKPTKPTKASVKKRLEGKKKLSEKKSNRKPPEF